MRKRIGIFFIIVGMLGLSGCATTYRSNMQRADTCAKVYNLHNAVEAYYVDHGKYPSSLDSLINDVGGDRQLGPYIPGKRVPVDAWGTAFKYQIVESNPVILSAGPDGTFGTSDDLRCR